jgi:hypothetical protein
MIDDNSTPEFNNKKLSHENNYLLDFNIFIKEC